MPNEYVLPPSEILRHAWGHVKTLWKTQLAGAVVIAAGTFLTGWIASGFSESVLDQVTTTAIYPIVVVVACLIAYALSHVWRAPVQLARESAATWGRRIGELERERDEARATLADDDSTHDALRGVIDASAAIDYIVMKTPRGGSDFEEEQRRVESFQRAAERAMSFPFPEPVLATVRLLQNVHSQRMGRPAPLIFTPGTQSAVCRAALQAYTRNPELSSVIEISGPYRAAWPRPWSMAIRAPGDKFLSTVEGADAQEVPEVQLKAVHEALLILARALGDDAALAAAVYGQLGNGNDVDTLLTIQLLKSGRP